jgi:hypothetical protein
MQATGISFKNPVTATEENRTIQYATGGGQRPKKLKAFGNDKNSMPAQKVGLRVDKFGMSPLNPTTRGETFGQNGISGISSNNDPLLSN